MQSTCRLKESDKEKWNGKNVQFLQFTSLYNIYTFCISFINFVPICFFTTFYVTTHWKKKNLFYILQSKWLKSLQNEVAFEIGSILLVVVVHGKLSCFVLSNGFQATKSFQVSAYRDVKLKKVPWWTWYRYIMVSSIVCLGQYKAIKTWKELLIQCNLR